VFIIGSGCYLLTSDDQAVRKFFNERQSAYTATSESQLRNGGEAMKLRKDSADKGAGSGCMARLVSLFESLGLELDGVVTGNGQNLSGCLIFGHFRWCSDLRFPSANS
jgi:hypothetical protein